MLEGTAASLAAPGGAHHACPDKVPGARLATIEAAGQLRVPYTSGGWGLSSEGWGEVEGRAGEGKGGGGGWAGKATPL
jgi:FO synthase